MTIEQSEQHTNPFASNVQPLASALATKSRIPLSIVSFDMTLPQSRQHMDATAFGSVLLGRILANQFGVPAQLSYPPEGLVCRMNVPVMHAHAA